MLNSVPAKHVSIYVGEDHQYHGQPTYSAILEFLIKSGVSGAIATRSLAGFGADHHLHTTRILRLTEDLPVKLEFTETPEKVAELLPKLSEMAGDGLVAMSDVEIVRHVSE